MALAIIGLAWLAFQTGQVLALLACELVLRPGAAGRRARRTLHEAPQVSVVELRGGVRAVALHDVS